MSVNEKMERLKTISNKVYKLRKEPKLYFLISTQLRIYNKSSGVENLMRNPPLIQAHAETVYLILSLSWQQNWAVPAAGAL